MKKFPEKNVLRFFREFAQKKARDTVKRKLAYVNPIFLSFSGQIVRNVIFQLNFEKNRKNAKISNPSKLLC